MIADLSKNTIIPYFGILHLQEVAANDSVDPIRLIDSLQQSWDRVVMLGNQPIVPEDGKVV